MNNNKIERTKIFLAEDDIDDRDFFLDALKEIETPTKVRTFDNGIDLMDALFSTKNLPEIIFLDLRMPLMNGFECLADIRSFSQFSHINVIVYSSAYHNREVNQLKDDGANHYLQKPSTYKRLVEVLSLIIQNITSEDKKTAIDKFEILLN